MGISIAYFAASIAALIELWTLLRLLKYRKSSYYALLFTILLIVNVGYFALSVSTNAEEALLATKFTYLGGTFQILFLLLCMCDLCRIDLKPQWVIPVTLVNLEIVISVFLTGPNTLGWHYTSYELMHENGITYLAKEYGPHHTFYQAALIMNALLAIVITVYAFRKKQKVSWIYVLLLGAGEIGSVIVYFVEKIARLPFELLPFTNILFALILILILKRASIYDVTQNVQLSLMNSNDEGFVVLDSHRHFIAGDDVARKIFPEINELSVDRPIEQPFLTREFGDWILESKEHPVDPKIFRHGDKDIKVTVRPYYNKSKTRQFGYLLQLTNDTLNQEKIRQMKYLVERDQLTKLHNRRCYEEYIESLRGAFHEITVIEFDLNNLKRTNDDLGHKAGDELIISAASLIEQYFGTIGNCYRTGGDEFVAIINLDIDYDDALIHDFEKSVNEWSGEYCKELSISYGIASAYDFSDYGIDELISEADHRMYDAKSEYYRKTGKDRRR